MSRAENLLFFLSEGALNLQNKLTSELEAQGYKGITASVNREEPGQVIVTFTDGEDSSDVVFSTEGTEYYVTIPGEEDEEEDVELSLEDGDYTDMVCDPVFLQTVLGLSGMTELTFADDDDEDDDDSSSGSPDAYGYTEGSETGVDEGFGFGPKKAKFVIRGGKKKKIFVRKRPMKMRGAERRRRKLGAKKGARKRRAMKSVMARKRKKSLRIRGRMHLKSLKGWRKKR